MDEHATSAPAPHGTTCWYADESGHSGPRYSSDQRFFVFGGPVVDASRRADMRDLVAGVSAKLQSRELKGSKLLKSASGRRLMGEVLRGTLDLGVPLLAVARDKRADLLTLVPQLLCDPDWNRHPLAMAVHFNGRPYLPAIAELPDDALSSFSLAYAARDATALRASVVRMADVLRLSVTPFRLKEAGMAYLPDVLLDVDCTTLLEEGRGFSPYEPALIQGLEMVRRISDRPPDVVLDEQAEYSSHIGTWLTGLGAMGLLKSVQMSHSHEEPGIQVADLLVVGVRHAVSEPERLADFPGLRDVIRDVVLEKRLAIYATDGVEQRLGAALR